jgi:hypothetical protein
LAARLKSIKNFWRLVFSGNLPKSTARNIAPNHPLRLPNFKLLFAGSFQNERFAIASENPFSALQ